MTNIVRKKFKIVRVQDVEIEIDLSKINKEAIDEYNRLIGWVGDEPEEHLVNIMEHFGNGNWNQYDMFLEGYGEMREEFDLKLIREETFVEAEEEKS